MTQYDQSALPIAFQDDGQALGRGLDQRSSSLTVERPFLKWAGGKSRLLQRILPHVPRAIENYHEPFLGGGAMFFAVRSRMNGTAHLTDLNEELITAWLAVQHHQDELYDALQHYAEQDSKDFYLSVRPLQLEGTVARAARFIYLNQTSWNGLWRVNKWGEFNVPWGDRPFRGISREKMARLAEALSDVVIVHGDFRKALDRPAVGDFVYLDPPYLPISDTSKFYLYTEQRFREPDLRELASLCRDLSRRGVHWIMSNRDTPLVRELFSDAQIVGLTVRRSVAAQNTRDVEARQSPEVIVVGVPTQ